MSKCDKCEARIYFARMFDIHIEQDDCPYDCEKEENKNDY